MKRLLFSLALLSVFLALPSMGANGDRLTIRSENDYTVTTWVALDAQNATLDPGVTIRVGAFESLTIWPGVGVDASNTWSVDCGVTASTAAVDPAAPGSWREVEAPTASTSPKRFPKGDMCEYIRINMDTNNTATTIQIQAQYRRH